MKHQSGLTLSIAVTVATLLIPRLSLAQTSSDSPANEKTAASAGMKEADIMVPAQAALSRDLVANKDHVGETFCATLSDTVHLKNGPELPRGTKLVGKIVDDDMSMKGISKLALRFTNADLKDGKTIPIRATIVSFYGPSGSGLGGHAETPGNQYPNNWTDQTLQVDQIGVLKGVDLHSRISGANSGVFVSTTDDHMKLSAGSELALAIAERQNRKG